MKTLKFDHEAAQSIQAEQKTSTWRLYDDKDISVDDNLRVLDKVDPNSSKSWKILGIARVKEVVEKKFKDVSPEELAKENYGSLEEVLEKFKGYYGQRVSMETPVKIIYFEFSPTSGDIPSGAMLLEEAKLYTDGGSRGNPGDPACAYAICDMDNTVVEKAGFYLGMATNNQAEYYGFKKGLERASELGINKISLFSDSQLVVNQMNGKYKVKNQELAPLHQEVAELANSFEKIHFVYVPRELNKTTDTEVNRILDEQQRSKKRR